MHVRVKAILILTIVVAMLAAGYLIQMKNDEEALHPSSTTEVLSELPTQPKLEKTTIQPAPTVSKGAPTPEPKVVSFRDEVELTKVKKAVLEAGQHVDPETRQRIYHASEVALKAYDQAAEDILLDKYEDRPKTATAKSRLLAIYHLIFSGALDASELCERLLLAFADQSKTASSPKARKAVLFDADKVAQHCGSANQAALVQSLELLGDEAVARQVGQYVQ